jgi:diguanylate cyclase (GGDEF)-like protein
MANTLRVLLIEDSEDDAALVVRELARGGYQVSFRRVDTRETLLAALDDARWDAAIADFSMPQFSGTAALALVRQFDPELPFIFVSGTMGEDAAVAGMRGGAQDYITKSSLKRLVPAVERELREVASRRCRRQAEERLAHLAYHDALTDLPNRVLLNDRLTQAMLAFQRTSEPVALMVIDLDNFKTVNDSLGHHAGDRMLQEVAARLRAFVRESDTVARLGGDEFAVMLLNTDAQRALAMGRKLLHRLNEPHVILDRPFVVSASIGIATFPEHGTGSDSLLQKADIAMYVAKSGGLGVTVYAPDRDRQAHRRLALTTEIRDAIERDQFVCHYQPIVSLQTNEVIRIEALARWQHPVQGLLGPEEFIQVAEQTGLIEPLTMLLIDKVLTEWAAPRARPPVPIAVNLSARHLRDPELPERVLEALQRHGAAPSELALEITENSIMSNPERSIACLSRLREMGISVAVDDFGTGYSSLSYLRDLPVDELKIDRIFVSGLRTTDAAIVRSTIELAHNLGLRIIAEGVESMAVCDRLRALRCDAAQGTFFAPPEDAEATRRWLERHVSRGVV